MVRELQLAGRRARPEAASPESILTWAPGPAKETQGQALCEHRTVARDGRIVCARIVEGDNEVSPNVCRDCPFKAVNCSHLRFSLRQTSASPLVVRHNGRTEIWDDGPGQLGFERAACAAKVMPVFGPQSCTGCSMHKPIQSVASPPSPRRQARAAGQVVPFPAHEPLAAAG